MTGSFTFRCWGDEQTEKLKQMWWDGLSAGAIAQALGIADPQSVSGKAGRSGFKRNPELSKKPAFQFPEHLLPKLRADGSIVTVADVGRGGAKECKWISGEEPFDTAPMCGREAAKGPFCALHRVRAYQRERAA